MNGWTRSTAQLITTKLDLNKITLKEAKEQAKRLLQKDIKASTKEQFIRALNKV